AVVDQHENLDVIIDGKQVKALRGDTVASALLASGTRSAGDSLYWQRPRGIFSAGVEEPNSLVHVSPRHEGDVDESMLMSTTVPVVNGLQATQLSGLGTLDPAEDQAYYDHVHVHTDVLVVGAGPADFSAALNATRPGAGDMLMVKNPSTRRSFHLLHQESQHTNGAPDCLPLPLHQRPAKVVLEQPALTGITLLLDPNEPITV